MIVNFSSYSSLGGRQNNEDSLLTYESGTSMLAVVADGLGGHADGEVASQTAIFSLAGALQEKTVGIEALQEAVQTAHSAVLAKQVETGSDMKTTIAAVWFGIETARGIHVGDSRIYHFRNDKILYQSMDHSLPQLDVLMGKITQDEIRGNIHQNCLTRVLGSGQNVRGDTVMLDVRDGDALLLCTDGFWELILEHEMIQAANGTQSARTWLERMRQIVESRISDTGDNHTAIAIMIGQPCGGSEYV